MVLILYLLALPVWASAVDSDAVVVMEARNSDSALDDSDPAPVPKTSALTTVMLVACPPYDSVPLSWSIGATIRAVKVHALLQ